MKDYSKWDDIDCTCDDFWEFIGAKKKTQDNDNVEHPAHYTSGKYETIDIIKDKLTTEQFYGFLCGNVLKYMTRWQNKNGIEDLKKAKWYLSYLIKEMENGQGISR